MNPFRMPLGRTSARTNAGHIENIAAENSDTNTSRAAAGWIYAIKNRVGSTFNATTVCESGRRSEYC